MLIRYLCILSVAAIFIGGREFVSIGELGIRLFDLLFILLAAMFMLNLIVLRKDIPLYFPKPLLFPLSLYFVFVSIIPLIGIIIYDYPIHYVFGDFRWYQIFVLFLVISSVYCRCSQLFLKDLTSALKLSMIVHLFILLLQYAHYTGYIDTSAILNFWFAGGTVGYGEYGYHIGRYSGAQMHSSALGLVSAFSFGVFLFKSYQGGAINIIFLLSSFVLLLASGSRASIGAGILIFVFVLFYYVKSIKMYFSKISNQVFALIALVVALTIAFSFNLGRFGVSDRYLQTLQAFIGQRPLSDVTPRFDRWAYVIEEGLREYPLGSLVSPSWALGHLPTIDSYYVLAMLQGHIVLPIMYILSLAMLFYYINKHKRIAFNLYFLCANSILLLLIISLVQNLMTDLLGKLMFIIPIIGINLLYQQIKLNKSVATKN